MLQTQRRAMAIAVACVFASVEDVSHMLPQASLIMCGKPLRLDLFQDQAYVFPSHGIRQATPDLDQPRNAPLSLGAFRPIGIDSLQRLARTFAGLCVLTGARKDESLNRRPC